MRTQRGRCQVWWHITAIPTPGKLRQENEEIKVGFGCKVKPKNKKFRRRKKVLKDRDGGYRGGERRSTGERKGRYR